MRYIYKEEMITNDNYKKDFIETHYKGLANKSRSRDKYLLLKYRHFLDEEQTYLCLMKYEKDNIGLIYGGEERTIEKINKLIVKKTMFKVSNLKYLFSPYFYKKIYNSLFRTKTRVTPNHKTLVVSGFIVDPNYRGKGLGKKLMDKLIEYGVNEKFDYIKLKTNKKNDSAINFYTKFGFINIGETKRDYLFEIKL